MNFMKVLCRDHISLSVCLSVNVIVSVYKSLYGLFWFSLVQTFHYALPVFIHTKQHWHQM